MSEQTNPEQSGSGRLMCMAHPERGAVAELENTGDGLCRDCYRLLINDPEALWALIGRARGWTALTAEEQARALEIEERC